MQLPLKLRMLDAVSRLFSRGDGREGLVRLLLSSDLEALDREHLILLPHLDKAAGGQAQLRGPQPNLRGKPVQLREDVPRIQEVHPPAPQQQL